MISLPNALVNNSKLKELLLDYNSKITTNGWVAFSPVSCNTSSIMGTFRSNHTLQKFHANEDRLPEDVRSHLRLNRKSSGSQAARFKVIKSHLREGFTVQPFVEMEWKALPRATAWMGRDDISEAVNEYISMDFLGVCHHCLILMAGENKKMRH